MNDGISSITVNTFPASIHLTPMKIIETIQLADKVSESEKIQMIEWFHEQFEDMFEIIEHIGELISFMREALSGSVSAEALEFMAKMIEHLSK